jgi:glycerophosphoryl diester phosphodiesterase
VARKAFLEHDGPIPFAHRGGASDEPENTMPAFQRAIDLGYRYLETDVHTTADGVLVAFHDASLDRVTDRVGAIHQLPWSVVKEARVAGREPIPKLEDLLGTWPEVRINIDPKADPSVGPLAEVIQRTRSLDRVCVTAFSERRVRRVRALLGPRVCTGTGPGPTARLLLQSRRMPTGAFLADCVQVPVRMGAVRIVTPKFLAAARRRDMPVHVWTIDDESTMRSLLDLGVDGIMTDRPATLKAVLAERGQWRD